MNRIKKILKITTISIAGLMILSIILGFFMAGIFPQYGGTPTQQQISDYEKLDNYKDDIFINQIPTSMNMKFGDYFSTSMEFFMGSEDRQPKGKIPVEKIDSLDIVNNKSLPRITWFGHSAFLLELQGKNILIDPMLGETPSPHSWLGNPRYYKKLPIEIEKMPYIDAVIISHDHYDHLDYGSIMKLKDKVGHFYVPLAVGSHFREWGIEESKITELNWHEKAQHDNLTFICAPARHFSGRGLTDRNETLWASWIIKSPSQNIYFSGDGGYGPHFKEIGEKYGPFNFAMMECGQYNEKWGAIHMMPEETVQAFIDVKGGLLMPIHWGAFTLALHSWTDPIERVTAAAKKLNVPIATPKVGEPIIIGDETYPTSRWWEDVDKKKSGFATK